MKLVYVPERVGGQERGTESNLKHFKSPHTCACAHEGRIWKEMSVSGYWPDAEATMGDITERLRAKADLLELMALDSPSGLCREIAQDNRAAADEIECLRDQLKGEGP